MTITTTDAAARLGIKETEVASVVHASEGVVITTTAGVVYVDVPEDTPDGEGKTGLMFRRLPDPERVYNFPCWVPPAPPELGDVVVDDPEPSDLEVPDGTVEDVADWVRGAPDGEDPTEGWQDRARAALAAEEARPKPRKSLVEALTEALDGDQAVGDEDGAS